MIADIHPHVISTDLARHPLTPLGGVQSTWSRDRPVPFQKLISEMDRAGIDKSAIVQASTAYGHDSSYVAEAIAAYPGRFTGVFSVDVLADDAVEKMRHWRSRGFGGMRLFTTGSTMPGQATWFDDPRSFPAWTFAGEAGIPVCMQMTSDGFAALRALMHKFPNVRNHSRSLRAPASDRRATVCGRCRPVWLCRQSQRVPQGHAVELRTP